MKKLLLILPFFSITAIANDTLLKTELEKMGATNIIIKDSKLNGFRTVIADQGLLYISENGQYIIQGKILEIKNGKAIDITNQALLSDLNALHNEMIIYPAKNQKHIVTVFVDITCHYCHVLYQHIKEYNDAGITLRLMAFPRSGLNSQTARQMEAIWTSEDKIKALDNAEKGELPQELKTPNIVKKHYELGIKFGVTGTPNMVTETGELIAGYIEPHALLKILEE